MTYKQIEQARETRMWLGQIIVPAFTAVVMVWTNPYSREAIKNASKNVVKKIKSIKLFRKNKV